MRVFLWARSPCSEPRNVQLWTARVNSKQPQSHAWVLRFLASFPSFPSPSVADAPCGVCPNSDLSHTMNELNGFRNSTPSQNRQLIISIVTSKQQVHDFVGELTFSRNCVASFPSFPSPSVADAPCGVCPNSDATTTGVPRPKKNAHPPRTPLRP